jgi:HEAT repeat protein
MRLILALALAATLPPAGPLSAGGAEKEPSYGGRTLSQWVTAMDSADPDQREKAANALKSIGRPAVPALSIVVIENPNALTRLMAVGLLRAIGGRGVAATLSRVVTTDTHYMTRLLSAQTLGTLAGEGDAEASAALSKLMPALMATWEGTDDEAASDATAFLEMIGKPATPALTQAALSHHLWHVRAMAVSAVGSLGRGVVPTLVKALEDPHESVRASAASTLGNLGMKRDGEVASAVPALIRTLKSDPHPTVRGNSAEALGRIGPPALPAVSALLEATRDPDSALRQYAAAALTRIDPATAGKQVLPLLVRLLEDRQNLIRNSVPEVIGNLGALAAAAVPALTRALTDPEWVIRHDAAEALGKIGPAARSAVPALRALLKDPEELVRSSAGDALKSLEAK